MKLYENIKARRKELGMTQAQLAKKLGYSDRSAIAHIESGKVDLPQSKIVLFADALSTSAGDLMGEVEKECNPQVERIAAKLERLTQAQLDIVEQMIDALLSS